jgi:hypothetical protein
MATANTTADIPAMRLTDIADLKIGDKVWNHYTRSIIGVVIDVTARAGIYTICRTDTGKAETRPARRTYVVIP